MVFGVSSLRSAAIILSSIGVVGAIRPTYAAEFAAGTLVSATPQGIVVRTANGDVPVAFTRLTTLRVFTESSLDALPDTVNCFLSGTVKSGSSEVDVRNIHVYAPFASPDPSAVHVRLSAATGDAELQLVPGILTKSGGPMSFVTGSKFTHLIHMTDGTLHAAPRRDILTNKSLTVTGSTRAPSVDIVFGKQLQHAGNGAKVRVFREPNNPSQQSIGVERVEPFTPPAGFFFGK